jgi:hypothetical protein
MSKNDKTPVAAGVCHCAEPCHICNCKSSTIRLVAQAPRMGTAMRAFLRHYVAELRSYDEDHGDRITRQMIDCTEFLLIEGERLEGGEREC